MMMILCFILFCFLTTTCLSQFHNVCPSNGFYSVVHMCKNEVEIGNKGLYLEAFVPAKTNTSCRCKVKVVNDQPLPVNINVTKVPARVSGSQLYTSQLYSNIHFTLTSEQIGIEYARVLNNTGFFINLETSFPSNDVTFCLKINIIQYTGNLSIQCISPNSSLPGETSTTKSEVTSTTTSQSTTTRISAIRSSSSTHGHDVNRDSNKRSTTSAGRETRSVEAVGGAVGGTVLIAVVVVVIVVFMIRKRKERKQRNESDYENTDISQYNPQNISVQNQNVSHSDNTENNYEHLQHGQHANTSSNMDDGHVYLDMKPTDVNDVNGTDNVQRNTALYYNVPSNANEDHVHFQVTEKNK